MSLKVHPITFNPFEENTYIISNDIGECIIIDPGCYDLQEQNELKRVIEDGGWKPIRLINTHCHIDHILGNAFVAKTYNLGLEIHRGELPVLKSGLAVSGMYGIPYDPSPDPVSFLDEKTEMKFGGTEIKIL